jgi:hypothetical protein
MNAIAILLRTTATGITGGINMGVFNQAINFSAIGSTMSNTALPWMNGAIQIVDPNALQGTWDPYTNAETGNSPTVIWSGPARIQHLKNDSLREVGFSSTSIRGIRVQIPLDESAGFIRKGLQVIVTDGGNDYELEDLQFVITSAINSSYAWLRTIEAEVDVKSVANNTWSIISGNVSNATVPISGATVRSFHLENSLWLLDYETTTDVYGNYNLPADPGVAVAVVAFANTYATKYYNNKTSFSTANLVTPANGVESQYINFVLVLA